MGDSAPAVVRSEPDLCTVTVPVFGQKAGMWAKRKMEFYWPVLLSTIGR